MNITISELFPTFSSAVKWNSLWNRPNRQLTVRPEVEYTMTVTTKITKHVYYLLDHQRHRRNGPAVIFTFKDGVKREEWYLNDLPSRDDGGPTIVEYFPTGKIKSEMYVNTKGDLDRLLYLPAVIEYYETGEARSQEWYRDDMPCNKYGFPTMEMYYKSGQKAVMTWDGSGEFRQKTYNSDGSPLNDNDSLRMLDDDGVSFWDDYA